MLVGSRNHHAGTHQLGAALQRFVSLQTQEILFSTWALQQAPGKGFLGTEGLDLLFLSLKPLAALGMGLSSGSTAKTVRALLAPLTASAQ